MTNTAINLVVALPAEAKPINKHLGLLRDNGQKLFPLYHGNDISLVITGPGKLATTNAIHWLHTINQYENKFWINIGIAGHPEFAIGEIFQARHIHDQETGDSWDLTNNIPVICQSANLITLKEPDTEYLTDSMIDMEASAVYQTALEYSNADRVHCLKIISDNRDNTADRINGKMVKQLIEDRLSVLDRLIDLIRNKVLQHEQ